MECFKDIGLIMKDGSKLDEESKVKDAAKAEAMKEAHQKVYEAISDLADTVGEPTLLQKLHLLDTSSWDEVVEERYLANLCGYPTCSNSVEKQNFTGRRFKIDQREKKVYTAIPLHEKFCSTLCYEKSCHIQQQLYEDPLWFKVERTPKKYSLELDPIRRPRRPEDILIDEADKLLLTRLNAMKIADNLDSASENEDNDNDEVETSGKYKKKTDDEVFVSEIRSFVSSVGNMTKKSNLNAGITTSASKSVFSKVLEKEGSSSAGIKQKENATPIKPPQKEHPKQQTPSSIKFTEKQVEEKLERLRQKHRKCGKPAKAILIDPLRMDPDKAARLPPDLR